MASLVTLLICQREGVSSHPPCHHDDRNHQWELPEVGDVGDAEILGGSCSPVALGVGVKDKPMVGTS